MRTLMLSSCLTGALALGACGSGPQIAVSGLTLTINDQLYVSRPMGFFCDALAPGQITIKLQDFHPACKLDQQVGSADPRDPTREHMELDIVLAGLYAGGVHENLMSPFSVSKVDCTNGPGDNGTAYFLHYPPNQTTPDSTLQVDSGSVKLDQFDKSNSLPAKGTFDLTFGGSHVTGSLNALDCDVNM